MENQAQLTGLAPIWNPQTRVMVLGSFPSVQSLQHQQYYAHPQNHFWRILGDVWGEPLLSHNYAYRCQAALAHGLGIWDVYQSCQRQGSLDSAIQHAQLNDLPSLQAQCPQLQAILHNGGESFKHAKITQRLGLPVHKLPSTSPANASWSYVRKLQAWREVLALYGLA